MISQANQSILWVVAALLVAMPQLASAQRSDESEVELAIERLWSADEAQARAARERLVDLGRVSVQPVTSLLSSIWKDGQKRHFARGKEREGAIAWAKHEAGADDGGERWRFEITSRLVTYTCEVLGRLEAVESVPELMEVVETEDPFGGFMRETPAVHALIIIGKPAAPYILSRFLLAAEEERRVKIGARPGDLETGAAGGALTRTNRLEHRAAQLLIGIGEDTVLPVLRSLLDETQYPSASGHARNAIGMIERREGRGPSPWYHIE